MSLRVVSHGGGVQTTAMLVLAATGRLDYKTFLFANVGDDSEHPATLRYLHEIAVPYAHNHGINIIEIRRTGRGGKSRPTLYQALTSPTSRSVEIPIWLGDDLLPGNRNCTPNWKIKVIDGWLRAHGATPQNKATVAVGLSIDELRRVNARKATPTQVLHYPLIGLLGGEPAEPATGRPLKRSDCEQIIRSAGLPLPGKSSCWFCPFQRPEQWREQRRHQPELFARACDLEATLIERRQRLGKDPGYLAWFGHGKPLAVAVDQPDVLPGMEQDSHCDNGWCMT